ncbi:MAG: TRAP transporter substrate-binding protein [Thermoleophilia bacterium]|nr:TRAP transporter substrate-binding protein [Thermoleophilia bacterium]
MNRRITVVSAVLAVFSLAVLAVGCGGGSEAAPTTEASGSPATTETATPPTEAAPEPVTLRMGVEWPTGDPRTELVAEHFVKAVADASGGLITVELFGGGEIAQAKDINEAIDSNLLDLALTKLSAGWTTAVPELTVLGLSVFDDSGHAFRALDGDLGTELAQALEEKGNAKLLSWITAGDVDAMGLSDGQITTPEDLKGRKMRASSKADAVSCEALGAVPVVIDSSEMYMALQRGTVDGVFITTASGVEKAKLYEVTKYWTRIPIVSGAQLGIVAGADSWEALDPAVQQTLMDAATGTRAAIADWAETGGAKQWDAVAALDGITTYVVPPDQISVWKDLMRDSQRGLLEEAVSPDEAAHLLDLVIQAR